MIYGIPPHEIMEWPMWIVNSVREYLSHEPSPTEKLEYAISQYTAMFLNANSKKGSPSKKTVDMMIFRDAWKNPDEEEGASIAEIAASLGAVRRKRKK